MVSLHEYVDRLPWVKINISLCSTFDTNKLTGPNFLDWYQNVRIILNQRRRLYVLKNSIPHVFVEDANNEVMTEYQCHVDKNKQLTYIMIASMSIELQR